MTVNNVSNLAASNKGKFAFLLSLPILCLVLFAFKNTTHKKVHIYSGQELYAGIIFGKGSVVSQVPLLENPASQTPIDLNSSKVSFLNKFETEIIFELSKAYPKYFDNLRKDLYSQNPLLIRKRLTEAYKMFDKAIFLNMVNSIVTSLEKKMSLSNQVFEINNLTDDFKKDKIDQTTFLNDLEVVLKGTNKNLLEHLRFDSRSVLYFTKLPTSVVLVYNNLVIQIETSLINSMETNPIVNRKFDDNYDLVCEKLAFSLATEL